VKSRPTHGWPLAASLVAHAAILAGVGVAAFHFADGRGSASSAARPPASAAPTLELPAFSEGAMLVDRVLVPEGEEPVARGGATVARMDQGVAGHGGSVAGARAVNLAAVDDAMRLTPDLLSRVDRDQQQRMRTAAVRATREDRRSSREPMELTFLASGTGERQERRAPAPSDPSRGSLRAPRAAVAGGDPGAREPAAGSPEAAGGPAGALRPGEHLASPGVGVRDGVPGERHAEAARVALARPSVTEGTPSVTAGSRGRPGDTVDSDQEVAAMVQAHVHASFAGGLVGEGRGGTPDPAADPGAGARAGRGSLSRPMGTGEGDVFDWYTSDPLLLPYFRKIHAKVNPLWRDAFPRSAMLELKQGTVILEFTIAIDGSAKVTWPPARPSGVDEFDRNCAEAIRRASPFEPLPASLREGGRTSLRIRAPFVAKNPIVK